MTISNAFSTPDQKKLEVVGGSTSPTGLYATATISQSPTTGSESLESSTSAGGRQSFLCTTDSFGGDEVRN